MNILKPCLLILGLTLMPLVQAAPMAEVEKLDAVVDVLQRVHALPEEDIPPALLRNAQGLAVIPGVIKAGFIVGGSYGTGVLTVRDGDGRWSPPLFIRLAAGSVGWQVGAQSTDVVLVFKTRRSIEGLTRGTFTLGADAAIAAGPVGRRGEAATDADLKAEILSYSRSRGLFAGVSLEGSKLDVDHDANADFYGRATRSDDILKARVATPPQASRFVEAVERATAAQAGNP